MMVKYTTGASALALALTLPLISHAGWDWQHPLDPVNKAAEQIAPGPAKAIQKAVDQTKNAATAPAKAAVDIATGKKPADKAVTEAVQQQGTAISATANAVSATHNEVTRLETSAAGAVAGNAGATIAAELNRPGSLAVNTTASSVAGIGDAIAHGDGSYLLSAHLAGALRDAHAKYDGMAKPLPTDVKTFLSKVHSADTLARARYVEAGIPDDLLSMLDRGNVAANGGGFAVVTDDIIVFSRVPGTSPSDLSWWAHEVTHTVQYKRLGSIDAFANAYTKNGPALEKEADTKGDELARMLLATR